MNNLTKHQDDSFDPVGEAAQILRDDLEAVYRLPVPSMRFDPAAVSLQTNVTPIRRRWRPALVAGAVAAGLAIFLVGPSLLGGSPQEVSAQDVLERTQEVAATNSPLSSEFSYHMMAKNSTSGPPGMDAATYNSTTETWYQDPQHQRMETYDDSGRLVFGQSQNGDDLWFYSSTDEISAGADGELRVVRTNGNTMGFTSFGAQDFGATSLSSLLDVYSGPCTSAREPRRGDGSRATDLRDRNHADAGHLRHQAHAGEPGRRSDDCEDGSA